MWADVEPCEVGARVSSHLRVLYPRDAAKSIARDFGVGVDTAKGWLSGRPPANRHMTRMVARWGKTFLDYVYAPHIGASGIEQRVERVLADMAALQADLRRLRNATSRRLEPQLDSNGAGAGGDLDGPAGSADRAGRAP